MEISEGRRELLNRQRCALRGDVEALRARLWALCHRAGLGATDRVMVIGDVAQRIDQTAQLMFPKARRILDYYHASERIWVVANQRWGEGSPEARQRAKGKVNQLKNGEVRAVIGSIKRMKMKAGEEQAVRRAALS